MSGATLEAAATPATASGASHDLRGHRADVEGMRALAVGLVVAYHAGVPFITGGYVGVDVFFVISGFLITGLLVDEIQSRGTLSFSRFYARRARRLLPMATLVLVATAVAFSIVLSPLDRASLVPAIRAATLYFANWHFAANSLVYGTTASVNPALHYWSLSVEEQFYVVWPILLFLVSRSRRGRSHRVLRRTAIALASLAAVSLALSILASRPFPTYSYYGLHTRAWELAAGGLLAIGSAKVAARVPAAMLAVLSWCGLAAIVVAAVTFDNGTTFPGYAAALPVGGTLMLLAAGGRMIDRPHPLTAGRLLSLRPVTYGGRISYSLYLWHWPCLVLAGTIAGTTVTPFAVAHGTTALIAVAAALALSVIFHHLLENPARLSRRMRPARVSLEVGAVAMAVAIVAATVLLPRSAGVIRTPVLADVAPMPVSVGGTVAAVGSNTGPVHVRLATSLRRARADVVHGTRDCYSGYQVATAPTDCVFGDPNGTVTVALVGDSHAEAMFPALDKLAQTRHWRLFLWAKPACPDIALAIRLPQFNDTYPWCAQWNASVLSRLAALPRLDAVFVTNFGGVATIPGRFAAADGSTLSASELPGAWRDAWHKTDRQLSAVSRSVIVIRDTPRPEFDVPACLSTHVPDERACSIPRTSGLRDADTLYRAEFASSDAHTHFVSLTNALCPGDPCPVLTETGQVIYRDSEHLTATVSAELAPVLWSQLRRTGWVANS